MRTNIDLDDELLREARKYSSASTKREIVEEALRTFVELKSNERRRIDYEKQYQEIVKKTANLRLGESAVDIIRRDRNRE
jgi:Arc/MetJ family transcription regulator